MTKVYVPVKPPEGKLLYKQGDDWSEEIIERAWEQIEIIAKEELRSDYYKPEITIITAKQMLDAYTSLGMPIYYKHWSFGKEFVSSEKQYKTGNMGLAYEIVINSDPCIAYLMEENNANTQVMVMAHASVGHSAVFKTNYLFKQGTDASSIIEYLNFAKNYIKLCEEKYGEGEVEAVIDACHSIGVYGIDKYKKPRKLSVAQEEERALSKFDQELDDYDPVWEKIGKKKSKKTLEKSEELAEPQENILYFIEKNAPHLPTWKREIIRISRKVAQYFNPQGISKVLNEGWASFCHYYIMNRLYDKGFIDEGSLIEFYAMHGNVVLQRPFVNFNPYKLGFSIFMDIKRLAEGGEWVKDRENATLKWAEITAEDREYFPDLINTDWVKTCTYAMQNFKDETFIQQYLSPKVARDLGLFSFNDPHIIAENRTVTYTSNGHSFIGLRNTLASTYAQENRVPDIQVTSVDFKGTRSMKLDHYVKNGRPLELDVARRVVQYIAELWEYSVILRTFEYDQEGEVKPVSIIQPGRYSRKKAEE